MDPYHSYELFFWNYLSYGDGVRGRFYVPRFFFLCEIVLISRTYVIDHSITVARSFTSIGHDHRRRCILSWTRTQGPGVCGECPRKIRQRRHALVDRAGSNRRLSQATPRTRHSQARSAHNRRGARGRGQGVAHHQLDANDLWRYHVAGVLSRRSHGPVRGAFHHGQRLHCIRYLIDGPLAGRAVLAS